MGRKGIKPKLLMCVVALSTMVSGILGGAPLHVKAAEEENYTVTFEAYEGTCETESISVPRGESLTLPGAVYEGHYLESWIDAVDNGNVTTFRAVGRPGDTQTGVLHCRVSIYINTYIHIHSFDSRITNYN